MRRCFLLVALVLVAFRASITAASVSVLFSPRGGRDQALVLPARFAQMYVDVACYTFSLDSVAHELRTLVRRADGATAVRAGEI